MLTVTIKTITAAYIAMSYQVTNTEPADIYVADLLYRSAAGGSLSVDPQLAYVMPQDDGTLYLGKFLMAIPNGMKVESPDLPYFRRLAPGETVSGEIVISNPASPYHAYQSFKLGETPVAVTRFVVQVGYIRGSDLKPGEATLTPAPHAGPDLFTPDYGMALGYQVLMQGTIQPAPQGAAFFPVLGVK
ncbi:hypothetical protein [Roseibium sp. M-1]